MQREACLHTFSQMPPQYWGNTLVVSASSFRGVIQHQLRNITVAFHGCSRLPYRAVRHVQYSTLPLTATDFQPSTFPHSLNSPTPPLSHHICLSALRVKDREGQADMERTALHQSGDTVSLCQLNGMCLCRKSQTHVPSPLPPCGCCLSSPPPNAA